MITSTEKQTKEVAGNLVGEHKNLLKTKCVIFALEGELGAGKTVFAKGVAEALGIKKIIRSPSFIIQREFPYTFEGMTGKFFHLDLWRMENEAEVKSLKIKELVEPRNVILIEWAEKMGEVFKEIKKIDEVIIIEVKIDFVDQIQRNLKVKV